VTGCLNLLDHRHEAALVVDVGGGSTELSWVDLKAATPGRTPPVRAWLSIPIGVVTLAERFPEGDVATEGWFRHMVEHVRAEVAAFSAPIPCGRSSRPTGRTSSAPQAPSPAWPACTCGCRAMTATASTASG
jgi:exopolyphosphatase/pppGpp-phosphohydrolase